LPRKRAGTKESQPHRRHFASQKKSLKKKPPAEKGGLASISMAMSWQKDQGQEIQYTGRCAGLLLHANSTTAGPFRNADGAALNFWRTMKGIVSIPREAVWPTAHIQGGRFLPTGARQQNSCLVLEKTEKSSNDRLNQKVRGSYPKALDRWKRKPSAWLKSLFAGCPRIGKISTATPLLRVLD